MSEEFGIAVIGAGKMGRDHIELVKARVKNARIVAAVDVDLARATDALGDADGASAHRTVEEALRRDDVNGVIIASPGPFHEDALYQTLERGLPTLCEKPLTPTPEASWRIVQTEVAAGQRLIQVGFMRRYDSAYEPIMDAVQDGSLGQLLMLHCAHRAPDIAPTFTTDMLISDSVVHDFDIIRALTGAEISSVQVRAGRSSRASGELKDPQQVLVETQNGVLADVEIFVNARYGYEVTTEAVFEGGVMTAATPAAANLRHAGHATKTIPQTYVGRFGDAYTKEIQAWVNSSRLGTSAGPSAWDGYAAAACCAAGIRSQSSGEREPVAQNERPALYN